TDATLSVCSDGAAVDLFGLLGGSPDPGGSWTMPPNADPFNGMLDPATHGSGLYTYTVAGLSPCPAASAQVNVQVVQAPSAGNDTTAIRCSVNPPVNMLLLLGGEPDAGGTWTDPEGNASSGTFTPGSS